MKHIAFIGSQGSASPPLDIGVVDLGFRCSVKQSSEFAPQMAPARLYPSITAGSFFFHTSDEAAPFLIIDLGFIRNIGQISIWNREDVGPEGIDRALPLSLSEAIEECKWNTVAVWESRFGGRLSGTPLTIVFSNSLKARFLKLEVGRRSVFHLDYVEILQKQPKPVFGKCISMNKDDEGVVRCDYLHTYNSGIFSSCSTALHDIMEMCGLGILPDRIDFTESFRYFKDLQDEDVYGRFFARKEELTSNEVIAVCREANFKHQDVHDIYSGLPLEALNQIATAYFSPSQEVIAIVERMLSSLGQPQSSLVSIVYRGTDKGTEVTLASIDEYIAVARALKKSEPTIKILMQTDQQQARDAVVAEFGDECLIFEDLPVTTSETVIHLIPHLHAATGRIAFSLHFFAAILIAARCKYLITHTGNVGAWLAIYRGTAENLFQFDATGNLVRPPNSAE